MRRRPPQLIELSSEDQTFLERLIRDGHTEQHVARRSRILVAMSRLGTLSAWILIGWPILLITGIWWIYCRLRRLLRLSENRPPLDW